MKHIIASVFSILLAATILTGLSACKKEATTTLKKEIKPVYSGTVLLNGFEKSTDLYKIKQHTYRLNNRWTGYSAKGKLSIVGKDDFLSEDREYADGVHKAGDLSPRHGNGALHINYISEIAESGGFTQLVSVFASSGIKDIPTEKIGGISLSVYNDNAAERNVTVSLVKSDMSVISFSNNTITLAPYSWKECQIDLNPAVVKYFAKDIVGVSIEFDAKSDVSYYIDDLNLSFEQKYTDEIKEYVSKVEKLESDIDATLSGKEVSIELKNQLVSLYERYLELPLEYQEIVRNYSDLINAITKYIQLVNEAQRAVDGTSTLLYFNEVFGLTQVDKYAGCKITYAKDVHAHGEEGSLCVEFDGTMEWVELLTNPVVSSYDEVHVWVKNDSEFASVMQFNWTSLAATKGVAYDENGNKVENSLIDGVDYNNNIIGKGGWIQLVWGSDVAVTNINLCSFDVKKATTVKSSGKIYIGKVIGISKASGMLKRIDALREKSSYSSEELNEIFDLYYKLLQLNSEQRSLLGVARIEKLEKIYTANKHRIIANKISSLNISDEYTAAQINEINGINQLYSQLSSSEKGKIDISRLKKILGIISDYDKNGKLMNVTAYGSVYEDNLIYSVKDVYSGKSSMKIDYKITDKNVYSVDLPEKITGAKKLKITLKNVSDSKIAFWPKVSDLQGGKWLEAENHAVLLNNDEGYKEFIYDIRGLTIDSFLLTCGPWENGNLNVYIDSIEAVTDLSKEVSDEISKLASLADKKEFTALEIKRIEAAKALYDGLSTAEKKKINLSVLNSLLKKVSYHTKSGANMDPVAYAADYENTLSYSLKDVYSNALFALKVNKSITNKAEINISLPQNITGKKLIITVKNNSDSDIAFWPKAVDSLGVPWLSPKNHTVIISKDEGWVELVYDINNIPVDGFVSCYGPWKNGDLELYIGKIEVITSYLDDVNTMIKNLSYLADKDEFTADEISEITDAKTKYNNYLTAAEKKKVNVTLLNKLAEKTKYYNTNGDNMNVVAYGSAYRNTLKYSVAQVGEGQKFSLKYDSNIQKTEATIALPSSISNAKALILTVKNCSDKQLAFWPKLSDEEGGTWLEPSDHSIFIPAGQDFTKLTYDIEGKVIDALILTYGPWESGHVDFYILDIEVVKTYLPQVKAALDDISDILQKQEFTAADVKKIMKVKELYDTKLTENEKASLDITKLEQLIETINNFISGQDIKDITKYGAKADNLIYSKAEVQDGKELSLKISADTGAGEYEIPLSSPVTGHNKLSVTLKNTSDKNIAFWFRSVNKAGTVSWLNPSNHNNNPVISASEGFVTLEYNIENESVDEFIVTYGPWGKGHVGICISDITVDTDTKPGIEKIIINDATGCEYADVSDGTEFTFNGSTIWCDLNFKPITFTDELHLFVQNNSEFRRYLQLNWQCADKVLDANGNDVTAQIVKGGVTVLPANDNSVYELIYYAAGNSPATQLNCATVNESGQGMNSTGSLKIKGYSIPKKQSVEYSQITVTSMTGGTSTSSSAGTVCTFNGSVQWCDINFTSIPFDTELHLFVQNNSEFRRYFQLNWKRADKILDEDGNDVTSALSTAKETVLPANDNKVYELIYYKSSGHSTAAQINCITIDGGQPKNSVGSLTIKGYTVK